MCDGFVSRVAWGHMIKMLPKVFLMIMKNASYSVFAFVSETLIIIDESVMACFSVYPQMFPFFWWNCKPFPWSFYLWALNFQLLLALWVVSLVSFFFPLFTGFQWSFQTYFFNCFDLFNFATRQQAFLGFWSYLIIYSKCLLRSLLCCNLRYHHTPVWLFSLVVCWGCSFPNWFVHYVKWYLFALLHLFVLSNFHFHPHTTKMYVFWIF